MTDTAAAPRRLDALRAYLQPKTAMMLVLGFSAGLPFLLYFSTLSVWLKESRVEEALIGFFSWFGLAYSFKFLWAPLIDQIKPPGLTRMFGHRRAWIFVAQIGIALSLFGLGASNPASSLALTGLFSFLLALSSATQDIGIDAWRIEAAETDEEQATLAAAYQYGYKVGMVISGGVALMIAGEASFPIAYFTMGAAMALAALTFAIWDRPSGPKAAASGGILLLSLGLATAFAAFASIAGEGTALQTIMMALQWAFYGLAALGGLGFIVFAILAMRHETDRHATGGDVLRGLMFIACVIGGVVLAAATLGYTLPRIASALGLEPDRRAIATAAGFVALSPIILGIVATWFIRQTPASAIRARPALAPFLDFFWRYGWTAILLLIFVSTYRLSDIVMGVMAKPAYSTMGYSAADIGIVSGTYGPWIVFVGVALAGVSAISLGLRTSLVIGAIVSLLGNAIFAWLVLQSPESLLPLFIAVTADNIAGGFAGTIFVAFLSQMVTKSFAGTQYAIFSSIYTLGPKTLAGTSGIIVMLLSLQDRTANSVTDGFFETLGTITTATQTGTIATVEGYSGFFILAAILGLPAIILSFFADRLEPDRPSVEDEGADAIIPAKAEPVSNGWRRD